MAPPVLPCFSKALVWLLLFLIPDLVLAAKHETEVPGEFVGVEEEIGHGFRLDPSPGWHPAISRRGGVESGPSGISSCDDYDSIISDPCNPLSSISSPRDSIKTPPRLDQAVHDEGTSTLPVPT